MNNKTVLYQRLQSLQNSQNTGLIYIGSHGTFVHQDPFQAGLGHEDNPEGRILIFDLNRLSPCGTKRPIFFVNACHSARWFQVKKEFFGLHEVILGYFAKAYVGVCGMVNMDFSLEAAKFILNDKSGGETDIALAKRLRDFRAEVVEQHLFQEDEKVLYAFMYVYYGNPLLKLRLNRASEPEGGDSD